jgi:undecaprenyl-diphosphatase
MKASLNLGLVLLLTTIALGFAIVLGVTTTIDKSLLLALALRNGSSTDISIEAARWISWICDPAQRTLIIIGFAGWIAWDRRFGAAVAMLVIPALAAATSSMLKEAFARPRPDIVPPLDQVSDLSFPSGHAAGAAALFLTAALLIPGNNPRTRLAIAILCAVIIGMTRIWLGVHYPSDVIGGWIWGVGCAIVGVALADRYGISRR